MQNDTLTESVWYTQSKDEKRLYASILEWPDNNTLFLGSIKTVSPNTQIHILGYSSVIHVSILLFRYITKIVILLYINFSG